jgi:hypothetical protein
MWAALIGPAGPLSAWAVTDIFSPQHFFRSQVRK